MSTVRKSSARTHRVPFRFGDSIHNLGNKNSDKVNINGSNEEVKKSNGSGGGSIVNGKVTRRILKGMMVSKEI